MQEMNFSSERFIGRWELVPAQSAYELGQPPVQGIYTIVFDGRQLHFLMEWTTTAGQELQQVVVAIPDGAEHPYDGNPAFADAIRYTLVDESTLDSSALKDGQVVGFARRVLSPDGNTMTITQSGQSPDGQPFTNLSVYRRTGAPG